MAGQNESKRLSGLPPSKEEYRVSLPLTLEEATILEACIKDTMVALNKRGIQLTQAKDHKLLVAIVEMSDVLHNIKINLKEVLQELQPPPSKPKIITK